MSESGPPRYDGPPPTRPPDPATSGPHPYPYGYPPQPPPNPYYPMPGGGRPGTLTAAAVLGFVAAGFLIIAGMLLLAGASYVSEWRDVAGSSLDGLTAEFTLCGLLDLAIAGLFIGGGVSMIGRNRSGRTLYHIAGALTVAEAVYWLGRWADESGGAVVFYALLFSALAVIGMSLAATADASRWLRRSAGQE